MSLIPLSNVKMPFVSYRHLWWLMTSLMMVYWTLFCFLFLEYLLWLLLRFFFLSLTFQSCTRVYQIVNFKNYTAGMRASFWNLKTHLCFALFFWPCCVACGILVLPPVPPALGTWSLNHWTARDILDSPAFNVVNCISSFRDTSVDERFEFYLWQAI